MAIINADPTTKSTPLTGPRADRSLPPGELDALAQASHGDPFAVLGMHETGQGLAVRTLQPGATRVWVIDEATGEARAELPQVHDAGLFAVELPLKQRFSYRLRIQEGDSTREIHDPYAFGSLFGEMDRYLFGEGNHLQLYRLMGAHPRELQGVQGVSFAVWAPNAQRVSVVGDFNAWDGRRHPMRKLIDIGVWEIFIPGLAAGVHYKYEIKGPDGRLLPLKADPLPFRLSARRRPPPWCMACRSTSGRIKAGWNSAPAPINCTSR